MDLYDRQGRPITMEKWTRLRRDDSYYRVAGTKVGQVWVSTVWLGIDHGFFGGPPVIFETMIFGPRSWSGLYSRRYTTEIAALAGHDQAVALTRQKSHGWTKHTRDERRARSKRMLQLLDKPERTEWEDLLLKSWRWERRVNTPQPVQG